MRQVQTLQQLPTRTITVDGHNYHYDEETGYLFDSSNEHVARLEHPGYDEYFYFIHYSGEVMNAIHENESIPDLGLMLAMQYDTFAV